MAKPTQNEKHLKHKIRKGDEVRVTGGKNAKKKGKVLKVIAKNGQIIVEGVNFIKKHQRPKQGQQKGGIIEKESPIKMSNVMLICNKCDKPTRIGVQRLANGSKARLCKKCGEIMDQ